MSDVEGPRTGTGAAGSPGRTGAELAAAKSGETAAKSGETAAKPRTAQSGSADRIAGAALVLAAAATALEATTFDVAFLTDPVGPKALPLLVAVMLGAGGARTLLRPRAIALPERPALLRMGAAFVVFLSYAACLPQVGFFLSTTMVVCALAVLFGGSWKGGLAAGLTLSASLWLLFVGVLSLPLPIGELWIR